MPHYVLLVGAEAGVADQGAVEGGGIDEAEVVVGVAGGGGERLELGGEDLKWFGPSGLAGFRAEMTPEEREAYRAHLAADAKMDDD